MFIFDGVELKKLEREDLGRLLKLKQESWMYTHHMTIANLEDQNRWFESLDKDVHCPRNLVLMASWERFPRFGIFKLSGVDWVNRTGEVAWDVFESYRGHGLGKKLVMAGSAFCIQILDLHRLNCEILEDNERSQKCAKAAGYCHEGTKRQAIRRKGERINSCMFGLLADQWVDRTLGLELAQ